MSKLTKYEKETIVLFNEGEDTASIYTYNAGLRKHRQKCARLFTGIQKFDGESLGFVLEDSICL